MLFVDGIDVRPASVAYEVYLECVKGLAKDSLSFYYDESEFESFLKFFEFLDGKAKFSYEHYEKAFNQFEKWLDKKGGNRPAFIRSAEDFLQFLYEQNVLCFIEQGSDIRFIRWCFIERSPTNISPKVKTDVDYEIHYSLANTLNTGRELRRKRER